MEYKGAIRQEEFLEAMQFFFPELENGKALENMARAGRVPPKVHGDKEVQLIRLEGELFLIPSPEEPILVVRRGKEVRALAFSRTPRTLPMGKGDMQYEFYTLDTQRARELYNNYTQYRKQEEMQ
jgi:hypothetical protein